ncbi:hypothetical protein CC2G_002472 [Coprinopsis cinerea AmutBmut pab1-1]|nr:hypothetical protein CC2G_002472 [Coprinopsis cinerea AmutBmut pab1-1]
MNYYPTSGYTAFCPSAPEARVPIIPDYPQHGYGREAEWGRNQVYPRDYANSSAGANQSSIVPFIPPEYTPEERGQGLHGASRYPHFYPQESYSPYSQTREPPVIPPYTWSDDQSSTDDDSVSDTGGAWDEASVVRIAQRRAVEGKRRGATRSARPARLGLDGLRPAAAGITTGEWDYIIAAGSVAEKSVFDAISRVRTSAEDWHPTTLIMFCQTL